MFLIFSKIIVLVLGSSFLNISIMIMKDSGHHIWAVIPPGFLLGTLVGSTARELLISGFWIQNFTINLIITIYRSTVVCQSISGLHTETVFPSPLVVHRLWDSVHCDRAQHNQENSKLNCCILEQCWQIFH